MKNSFRISRIQRLLNLFRTKKGKKNSTVLRLWNSDNNRNINISTIASIRFAPIFSLPLYACKVMFSFCVCVCVSVCLSACQYGLYLFETEGGSLTERRSCCLPNPATKFIHIKWPELKMWELTLDKIKIEIKNDPLIEDNW